MCEFSKTFCTEKSETICKYINRKKDIRDDTNKPDALIEASFKFLFFIELINWTIPKIKVKKRAKFPKEGIIR